jgi:type IV secretory pathway protease TraF
MKGRLATTVMTFGAVALVMSTMGEATPIYIWNASKSVPIGLYRLQPASRLAVADLVAARPPEPLTTFLDLNGYLPIGVPMLKRVLALPGQTVCRKGLTISVDATDMGDALSRDSRGRPLPIWQGCRVVGADELFLMNWQSEDLFGRSLLWLFSQFFRHWQGAACVDQGAVIVIALTQGFAIPLFDRTQHHSSVPTTFATPSRAAAVKGGRQAGAIALHP